MTDKSRKKIAEEDKSEETELALAKADAEKYLDMSGLDSVTGMAPCETVKDSAPSSSISKE